MFENSLVGSIIWVRGHGDVWFLTISPVITSFICGWVDLGNAIGWISKCWLDMGKLVVLNAYIDVDLLKDIAARYDHVSKVVKTYDGLDMVNIIMEWIV